MKDQSLHFLIVIFYNESPRPPTKEKIFFKYSFSLFSISIYL